MFSINFDKPFYSDLEPEEKSSEELILLVMKTANGDNVVIRKYNEQEINRCARKLIQKGLIRGTIFGTEDCSWSKLTQRGRMVFKSLTDSAAALI